MCKECQQMIHDTETGRWECLGEDATIESDSWSNWQPDPQRVFREHDPALEPFASMSKAEILEAMFDARGGQEWELLREFLLDKCDEEERQYDRFTALLRGLNGERDEFCYLNEVAGPATRLVVSASINSRGW